MPDFMPFEFTPQRQAAFQAVAVRHDVGRARVEELGAPGPEDTFDPKPNLEHARWVAVGLDEFMVPK